jgi:hypothetical protein
MPNMSGMRPKRQLGDLADAGSTSGEAAPSTTPYQTRKKRKAGEAESL